MDKVVKVEFVDRCIFVNSFQFPGFIVFHHDPDMAIFADRNIGETLQAFLDTLYYPLRLNFSWDQGYSLH